MSKKEIILQELERVAEKDLNTLLSFIHSLKSRLRFSLDSTLPM